MRIDETICMYATDAHAITESARQPKNVWNKLFERIKEEAEHGKFMLVFDEDKEDVSFSEHRKEVKRKLEELGYECAYRRVANEPDFLNSLYHNEYTICW